MTLIVHRTVFQHIISMSEWKKAVKLTIPRWLSLPPGFVLSHKKLDEYTRLITRRVFRFGFIIGVMVAFNCADIHSYSRSSGAFVYKHTAELYFCPYFMLGSSVCLYAECLLK